jgi:hypothetical protein
MLRASTRFFATELNSLSFVNKRAQGLGAKQKGYFKTNMNMFSLESDSVTATDILTQTLRQTD